MKYPINFSRYCFHWFFHRIFPQIHWHIPMTISLRGRLSFQVSTRVWKFTMLLITEHFTFKKSHSTTKYCWHAWRRSSSTTYLLLQIRENAVAKCMLLVVSLEMCTPISHHTAFNEMLSCTRLFTQLAVPDTPHIDSDVVSLRWYCSKWSDGEKHGQYLFCRNRNGK